MSTHPFSYQALIAYATGELLPEERETIERHLQGCPTCTQTVARYRLVWQTMQNDESEAPPARLVSAAKLLFAARARTRQGMGQALQHLLATLTFDSRTAWAGTRSSASAYQLGWESAEADVDLQLTRAGNGWQLRGQVMPQQPLASVQVALVMPGAAQGATELASTTSDERGHFTLTAPPGRYELHLTLAEYLLILPQLELGAE
jgi:anti-sigma factor RsiW